MNMYLELILPGLVIPFGLSVFLFSMARRYPMLLWGLPLIWLPSYIWMIGWPVLPQEANEWLWLLVVLSTGINFGLKQRPQQAALAQISLLGLALIAITWPVLIHQPGLVLALELLAVLCAAVIFFFNASFSLAATPSLALAISSAGLALVTALGGSVLVGQLAGALASILGAYALYEVYRRFAEQSTGVIQLAPVVQVYFALLLIARVYAEIPLFSALMLLIAPLIGLMRGSRYAALGSAVMVAIAFTWLLTTADSSSYY